MYSNSWKDDYWKVGKPKKYVMNWKAEPGKISVTEHAYLDELKRDRAVLLNLGYKEVDYPEVGLKELYIYRKEKK